MTTLTTELTKQLGIKHPILLAGMNSVSHGDLVAAVSNAGGLGTIGGLSLSPKMLRKEIARMKELLIDKNAPFGVDLALPQVGGNARKTNHDYTHGNLPELIDIVIEEGARLFVSAVGVPPKWVVDKLHAAGIPVMNMCGHPKHIEKALEVGCDIMCCQGSEGGGHTGDIGTSVLIPECVDLVRGKKSKLTGGPVHIVAAGGIIDGRGLAAALSYGAQAVWVGTRFVNAKESAAPKRHKEAIIKANSSDTVRTLVYSGRPLRTLTRPYVTEWEAKPEEIKDLISRGIVPVEHDMKEKQKSGEKFSFIEMFPFLSGQGAGNIGDVKTAKEIVDDMVGDAIEIIQNSNRLISRL